MKKLSVIIALLFFAGCSANKPEVVVDPLEGKIRTRAEVLESIKGVDYPCDQENEVRQHLNAELFQMCQMACSEEITAPNESNAGFKLVDFTKCVLNALEKRVLTKKDCGETNE